MKKAEVIFCRYESYLIDISDEDYYNGNGQKAIDSALKLFRLDTGSELYDDVEVEFIEEDEEDED